MSERLDNLYKEKIKEEARHPFHFEKKEDMPSSMRAYNPICGDRFDLYYQLIGESIDGMSFHGFGCMISKASTSFMIRALEGRTTNEAIKLADEIIAAIENDGPITVSEMTVFEHKNDFAGRHDCILLPWKAIKKGFEKTNN